MKQIPINNTIGDTLSLEQTLDMQKLGGLDWSARDIAIYFQFDIPQFITEYNDPNSIVCLTVSRGRLQAAAMIGIKTLENATAGDVQSIKLLENIRRDRSFEMTKLDVFGGFEDEKSYQRIMNYIASGASEELSPKMQLYIDLLNLIFSLSKQHDRRNVIRFLTRSPFNMSYARAVDAYDESINLFYSNRNISRDAMRHKYAEALDSWAQMAANTAKCANDYAVAGDLKAKAAKILRLDQPEQEQLPASQYMKPIRLLSLNPSDVGFEPANRNDLLPLIEKFAGPDAVKRRLRMEAGIENVDFIEIITNVAQEED